MITLNELINSAEKSPYTLAELQGLVIDWAKEKGIDDADRQYVKINEEFGELNGAFLKNNTIGLIDSIGDTLVTLIIQSDLTNTLQFREVGLADTREGDYFKLHRKFNANYNKDYYEICGELIQSIAHLLGLNPIDCLYSAYRIISKRKGTTVNGTFIKEEETEPLTAEIENELPKYEID